MHRIEFKSISVRYGTTGALEQLSLEVNPSEFLALLGPSGCGKTSLLRVLSGFVPYVGSVLFDGQPIDDIPSHRRGIGIVFQDYALFPHRTVRQNIAFGLRMRKEPAPRIRERVTEMVALLHLDGLEERYPNQLSGGQQQRVALARAIAIKPAVLLLDEPLSSLDKKLRDEMQIELRRLQRQIGITTIFVTHDQEEALSLADRIAIMNRGRIQQVGPPFEIYERPANHFVAEFIGRSNILTVRVLVREGKAYRCATAADGAIRVESRDGLAIGQTVRISVRPENLSLTPDPERVNGLDGTIDDVVYRGGVSRVRIRLPDGQVIESDHPGGTRMAAIAAPGSPTRVCWRPEDAVLLNDDA